MYQEVAVVCKPSGLPGCQCNKLGREAGEGSHGGSVIKTRGRKMKTQAGGSSFEMVASHVNPILLTLNLLPDWAFSESLPEPAIQAQLYSPTVVQLGDMHTDTRPHGHTSTHVRMGALSRPPHPSQAALSRAPDSCVTALTYPPEERERARGRWGQGFNMA